MRCQLKQVAGFPRGQLYQAAYSDSSLPFLPFFSLMGKAWKKSERLTAVLQPCESPLPALHAVVCATPGSRSLTYLLCVGWQSWSSTARYLVLVCTKHYAANLTGCFCSGSYSGQLFIYLQRGYGCTSPTSSGTQLSVSSCILSLRIFPRPEYRLDHIKGWCHRATFKATKVSSLYMSWAFSSCLEFPFFSLEEILPCKITTQASHWCQWASPLCALLSMVSCCVQCTLS